MDLLGIGKRLAWVRSFMGDPLYPYNDIPDDGFWPREYSPTPPPPSKVLVIQGRSSVKNKVIKRPKSKPLPE